MAKLNGGLIPVWPIYAGTPCTLGRSAVSTDCRAGRLAGCQESHSLAPEIFPTIGCELTGFCLACATAFPFSTFYYSLSGLLKAYLDCAFAVSAPDSKAAGELYFPFVNIVGCVSYFTAFKQETFPYKTSYNLNHFFVSPDNDCHDVALFPAYYGLFGLCFCPVIINILQYST